MKTVLISACVLLVAAAAVAMPAVEIAPAALSDDVIFNLYTVNHPDTPFVILMGDNTTASTLPDSDFDANNKTKILIHGYTENLDSSSIQEIRKAYMRINQGYNVIAVSWQRLASGPVFNTAKNNVVPVGEYVASFIDFLNSAGGARYADVHILGFDLGAHVAGVAGLRSLATIARVTGLDPTLNGYATEAPENMLHRGDAKYVDVIHTDGDNNGFMTELGDADFYPNDGIRIQNGCGVVDPLGACSHAAAYLFYAYSIDTPDDFSARRCETLDDIINGGNCDLLASGLMGHGSVDTMRGFYHLRHRVQEYPPLP